MMTNRLEHDKLEELFQYYADIPNINEYKFLLEPYQYAAGDEPIKVRKYHSSDAWFDPLDGIRIARSRLRYTLPKSPAARCLASLSLSIPEQSMDLLRLLYDGYTPRCRYIAGSGRLQETHILMRHPLLQTYIDMLTDLVAAQGKDTSLATEIAEITGFSYRTELDNATAWADQLRDGDDIAEERHAEGHDNPCYSLARVSGLVYMPVDEQRNCRHFRVRVKRAPLDRHGELEYPDMYSATNGYDLINVYTTSDTVLEDYHKIQQGHPVYVEGIAEPYKFFKHLRAKSLPVVADLLGVIPFSDPIRQIIDFFNVNQPEISFTSISIIAQRITTDPAEICEIAAGSSLAHDTAHAI